MIPTFVILEYSKIYLEILNYIILFLIIGVSLSALKQRIIPKKFHPISEMISMIPDQIVYVVVGDGGVIEILQIFTIIIINKILIKFLIFRAINLVIFILFKSTMITYDIVISLANFGTFFPIFIILLLPIIKRGSWYYMICYFTICGGSCLILGLGSFSLIMMSWKNLVQRDLDDLVGW